MPRDAQNKNNSKSKQMKKAEDEKRKRKQFEDSGSDSNSSDSESDEMNSHEYRKFLHKLFPSKHLNDKIKAGEKLKKQLKTKNVYESEEEEVEEKKQYVSKRRRNKKHYEEFKESESDYETEESLGSQDTDEDTEYNDEEKHVIKSGSNKFNIIFTIGGSKKDHEDDDFETEDEEDIVLTEQVQVPPLNMVNLESVKVMSHVEESEEIAQDDEEEAIEEDVE